MAEQSIGSFSKEQFLDAGLQSRCYRKGDTVWKITHTPHSLNRSLEEYGLLTINLGKYVINTEFSALDGEPKNGTLAIQPYFDGVVFKDAIELSTEAVSPIESFLIQCLNMYTTTKQLPDIFGRPHIVGWYNPLTTPNAKISIERPSEIKLLDVGLARLSRAPIIKIAHNSLLVSGIQRALNFL